eukprot:5061893-Amphidinium_carterae.1
MGMNCAPKKESPWFRSDGHSYLQTFDVYSDYHMGGNQIVLVENRYESCRPSSPWSFDPIALP